MLTYFWRLPVSKAQAREALELCERAGWLAGLAEQATSNNESTRLGGHSARRKRMRPAAGR